MRRGWGRGNKRWNRPRRERERKQRPKGSWLTAERAGAGMRETWESAAAPNARKGRPVQGAGANERSGCRVLRIEKDKKSRSRVILLSTLPKEQPRAGTQASQLFTITGGAMRRVSTTPIHGTFLLRASSPTIPLPDIKAPMQGRRGAEAPVPRQT
ncbi:hypothetical protein BKA66DRAFT_448528 [Pyrenochaeta sp. MPI-SDFR-AT-0127]|nr:hypothetical protein BKA66DRAFT_448528 [Pyrenochaeta sp. MPI-SDFR-AT-0127]